MCSGVHSELGAGAGSKTLSAEGSENWGPLATEKLIRQLRATARLARAWLPREGGNSSFAGQFDIFQGHNPTSNPGLL